MCWALWRSKEPAALKSARGPRAGIQRRGCLGPVRLKAGGWGGRFSCWWKQHVHRPSGVMESVGVWELHDFLLG